MTTTVSYLDPELEGLLQEIARDPRSKLLKAPRPRTLPRFLDRPEPVSPNAAGLSIAERELLRVYREEVAYLLRVASLRASSEDSRLRQLTSLHWSAREKTRLPSRATIDGQLLACSRELESHAARQRFAADNIRKTVLLYGAARRDAQRLATLSLRLVAHDSAWLMLGQSILRQGYLRSACDIFHQVRIRNLHGKLATSSASWIGVAHRLAQELGQARDAFQEAAELGDGSPNDLLNLLAVTLSLGDAVSAVGAAERVDDSIGTSAPVLADWIESRQAERGMSSWTPSPTAVYLARRLSDAVGPASHELIDVFLA